MLAKKENKEIERAINTLDFISEDPIERERHNSIVMAEYNRLTSQHNFYKAGIKEGLEKRKRRGNKRNSKRVIKNKNANRTNHTDNKTNKRRNRKNKIIKNK